ncbi:MAG: glycosyl transferase family 2 [Friedmanniella sp.]|nr:glycosyl transferase family 2 [Friedmanniella sp.]
MQGSGTGRDHAADVAASDGPSAGPPAAAPAPGDLMCTEVELSAPPVAQDTDGVSRVRVLARLHHIPLGFVEVDADLLARPEELSTLVVARLEAEVRQHLSEDGLAPAEQTDLLTAVRQPCPRPDADEHVSVVIGTRNRAEHVRGCLEQLLRLDYPSFDVIVVENGSHNNDTEVAFAETVGTDSRFRYLNLDRAGVSRARNAGMWAARGPLVAFIDDDVRVDTFWLQGVARAFRRSPDIVCVTGLIATRSIAGPEQLYFDSRVSWASNLQPRVFHPTSDDPLHPWAAGRFGAGANMAFRLEAVRRLGGFDENLGPGTKAKGGEDIDLFVRALRAGGDLAYDPAALAWHIHRSDAAGLEQQMFGYGVGLTAYLTKHAVHPSVALEMLVKTPRAVRHVLRVTRTPARDGVQGPAARRYRRIELTGMVLGPLYYLRSRLAGRGSSVKA